jgi:hypothetical protein
VSTGAVQRTAGDTSGAATIRVNSVTSDIVITNEKGSE